MFGKTQDGGGSGTGSRDERLSDLLQKLQPVEPGPGFNTAVWRRIRRAPSTQSIGLWDQWLDWFMPHPVWAGAAATTVALVVGLLAGMTTPSHARDDGHGTHALLHPGTLMGTYATLSERGHP